MARRGGRPGGLGSQANKSSGGAGGGRSQSPFLTRDEASLLRELLKSRSDEEEIRRERAREEKFSKLMTKKLRSFGKSAGLSVDSDGSSSASAEDSPEDRKRRKKAAARKRSKLRMREELASLRGAEPELGAVPTPAQDPRLDRVIGSLEALVPMISNVAATSPPTMDRAQPTSPFASPEAPPSFVVSTGDLRALVAEAMGVLVADLPAVPLGCPPTVSCPNTDSLRALVREEVVRCAREAPSPVQHRASSAPPRRQSSSHADRMAVLARRSDGRVTIAGCEMPSVSARGAVTLVEWLAPTDRKELLALLETDAVARIQLFPVTDVEFEKAVHELVAGQASVLYEKVLKKTGKEELRTLCERLKLPRSVFMKMTCKQMLTVLLVLVRVLPHSQ